MKQICVSCPDHPDATLEGYLLDCDITLGHYQRRPAVIVCPGGGYVYCSPREGEPVALRYAASGFHAFILRYSVGPQAKDFAPWKEISWAIGHLRENAEAWNIDPDRIATCGFSAGGHVALAAGLMGEHKPNAMILNYPAVNVPNHPGVNFMIKLLTGKENVTDEDAAYVSLSNHITKSAPPVFITATAEDLLTNYGALPVAQKYAALGLGYELHIFQHGPHGYALGDATSADGSSRLLNSAYAHWLDMSVAWLLRTFGPLKFEDKSVGRMGKYMEALGITMQSGLLNG